MGGDWSREEVEATVADYLAMFGMELRGESFNKSEHRRRLSPLLNARSDGAIELKHQNISAILLDLGIPRYIEGYKPRHNYQGLLFDVVASRIEESNSLTELVRAQVEFAAPVPTVDDILDCLVAPPVRDPDVAHYDLGTSSAHRMIPRRVDFIAVEAANRKLGAAGEEFVVRFEVARLLRARHDDLAKNVERVSKTRGDGMGYDILSFEESGRERLIEVKTTGGGRDTPFYVTRNELAASHDKDTQYFLYRVFSFPRKPGMFYKQGHIGSGFRLEPAIYNAKP